MGSFILWTLNFASNLRVVVGQIHGMLMENNGGPINDARVDALNNSLASSLSMGNWAFFLMASNRKYGWSSYTHQPEHIATHK